MMSGNPLFNVVRHYPELIDKPNNGYPELRYNGYGDRVDSGKIIGRDNGIILPKCTQKFISGYCDNGHKWAKAIYCDREWCMDCGKKDSDIHKRRFGKWIAKVIQMKKVGYLVVTIPKELRAEFKNKQNLIDFRQYLKRKLERMGYNKGFSRWHWAGDCPCCRGAGCVVCDQTGAGREWKPHLNFIIEEGFLTPEKFDKIIVGLRKDISVWFGKKFPHKMPLKVSNIAPFREWSNPKKGKKKFLKPQLKKIAQSKPVREFAQNIFYRYAKTDGKKIHILKYITRATWRFYDFEICNMLKGFRTGQTWGKWEKSELKRVSELVSLSTGHCSKCLQETGEIIKIVWFDEISTKDFKNNPFKHVDAGYYTINNSP